MICVWRAALVLLVFALAASARAENYYVNAALGSDTFSGTVADGAFVPAWCALDGDNSDCTDGPWATLARMAAQALVPGDSVRLRCGDTWYEPLHILYSGQPGNPILFSRYGSACPQTPPTIDGTTVLNTWRADAVDADTYSSDDIIVSTTQMFRDGVRMTVAREPNAGADPYRYITGESTDVSASMTARHYLFDTAYPQDVGVDPTGAEIHIRNRRWRLQDRVVTGYDATLGRLRWDDITQSPSSTELTQSAVAESCLFPDNRGQCGAVKPGYGYYLANLRWMLDVPGEWQQERDSKRIRVRMGSGLTPGSFLFTASVLDFLVVAAGQTDFILEGLALNGARLDAISLKRGSSIVFRDLVITNAGGAGMHLAFGKDGRDIRIEGNVIRGSSSAAIRTMRGSNVIIEGNTLTDTGNLNYANPTGLTYLSVGRGIGLSLGGQRDYLVNGNQILRSAYSGIQVGGSIPGSTLSRNRIDSSCSLLDDGGGLYIGGILDKVDDMRVVSNIISHSIGNSNGVPGDGLAAEGIYLDSDCESITVLNNTVWGVGARGIYIHNAYNNSVRNNVLYGNHFEIGLQETYNEGMLLKGFISNNVISENILYHLGEGPALTPRSVYDNFDEEFDFGRFSKNIYNGTQEKFVISERYVSGGETTSKSYTLKEWQNARGQGVGSVLFRPFRFAPFGVSDVASENMVFNSSFDTDSTGWSCWFPNKVATDLCVAPNPFMQWVPALASSGGRLEGGANMATQLSMFSRNDLSVVGGQTYLVQFLTQSEDPMQTGRVIVRKTGGSYDSLGLSAPYRSGLLAAYQVRIFVATESFDAARIGFWLSKNSTMSLDDVSVRPATVGYNEDGEYSALIVNMSAGPVALASASVEMGEVVAGAAYIGVDGNPIDWQAGLGSLRARIVVRADAPTLDTDFDGVADADDLCPRTPDVQTSNYEGCSYYQLNGTPCTGVICDAPAPENACADDGALRTYAQEATCVEGVCQFEYSEEVCAGGCIEGACGPLSDAEQPKAGSVHAGSVVGAGCACDSSRGAAAWLFVLFACGLMGRRHRCQYS